MEEVLLKIFRKMAFKRSHSASKSPGEESKGELAFQSADSSLIEVGTRNTPLITDQGGRYL